MFYISAAFIQPASATPLHKVKVDNVTEYQERKQQKIQEKLNKRKNSKGGHNDSVDKKIKT